MIRPGFYERLEYFGFGEAWMRALQGRCMTRTGLLLIVAPILLCALALGAAALIASRGAQRLRERVQAQGQRGGTHVAMVDLPSIRVGHNEPGRLAGRLFALLRFHPDIPQEHVIPWPVVLAVSLAAAAFATLRADRSPRHGAGHSGRPRGRCPRRAGHVRLAAPPLLQSRLPPDSRSASWSAPSGRVCRWPRRCAPSHASAIPHPRGIRARGGRHDHRPQRGCTP